MNKMILGVRFIEKDSKGEFFCRTPKTYNYLVDKEDAILMIGNVCNIVGYNNYIVPIEIKDEDEDDYGEKTVNLTYIPTMNIHFCHPISKIKWSNNGGGTPSTQLGATILADRYSPSKTNKNIEIKKENNNMNMPNMHFGPYNNSRVSLSFYGIAVQNGATKRWMSFKGGESYDVSDFIMPGVNNMIFAMPVSIKKIAVGDIILHNNIPMIVQKVSDESNVISAIDVSNSEVKSIIPAKNPMGFNFYTKLISMFGDSDIFGGGDDGDDIFGSNPMMMMAMMGGFGNDNSDNPMGNMMQMMMMGRALKDLA